MGQTLSRECIPTAAETKDVVSNFEHQQGMERCDSSATVHTLRFTDTSNTKPRGEANVMLAPLCGRDLQAGVVHKGRGLVNLRDSNPNSNRNTSLGAP